MTTTLTRKAPSFTKLRDGSWGIKGSGLAAGATISITKRDGKTSTVTVDRIIWSGQGVQIASIVADTKTATKSVPRRQAFARPAVRNGTCQGCGNEAWDCCCYSRSW